METTDKPVTISFRTKESLKNDLEKMAVKDNRSMSNLIEVILQRAVEEHKNKK